MTYEVNFWYVASSLQYKFTNQNLRFSDDVAGSTGAYKKSSAWWRHTSFLASSSHNFVKNDPILIIFSPKCHFWSIFSKLVSYDRFWKVSEKFKFWPVNARCRRATPGCTGKKIFGDHVRNENFRKSRQVWLTYHYRFWYAGTKCSAVGHFDRPPVWVGLTH